jgi:hypothetical protein
MYLNSEAADLSAKFSISKQAYNMVLDAGKHTGFTQHGDQVGLSAARSKLVDYVDMNHD